MNRRFFLRGALALGAITAANVPLLAAVPRIVGNGIHDDGEGLQAFIDGRPFLVDSETVIARDGILKGRFLLSKTLDFVGLNGFNFDAERAHFHFADNMVGGIGIHVRDCERCRFSFGSLHGPSSGKMHTGVMMGNMRWEDIDAAFA